MSAANDATAPTAVTQARIMAVAGDVESFVTRWDEEQEALAGRLKRVCDVRARTAYLQGGLRGLSALEDELGLRAALAAKMAAVQAVEVAEIGTGLRRLQGLLLGVTGRAAWLRAACNEAAHPMPPLRRALQAIDELLTQFADGYAKDLLTKEVVLAGLSGTDGPRDARTLSTQLHAFATQPFVTEGLKTQLVEVVYAATLLL